MATRIGPAHSVRVAVAGSASGKAVVNVFWCSLTVSGTVTQADLDTWTLAFGNAFKTAFSRDLPGQYTFGTVSATYFVDGTATNVLQSTQNLSGSATGGSSIDLSETVCISWLSSVYWRGGKPRTYICALGGASTSANPTQLQASVITQVGTDAGTFMTSINGLTGGTTITGTSLGFVSFFTANGPRTPPLYFAFTGHKIHPRIASQRRRLGKWVP